MQSQKSSKSGSKTVVLEKPKFSKLATAILSKQAKPVKKVEPPPSPKPSAEQQVKKQPTVRLDKRLTAMRNIQRSRTPIFKPKTIHRMIKHQTREVMQRHEIKYGRKAVELIMNVLETLLLERLLKAHSLCLTSGKRTLKLSHLNSAEQHISRPNVFHWSSENFKQEEQRLDNSRFPQSRLSEQQH
jgi:histone H3/H4